MNQFKWAEDDFDLHPVNGKTYIMYQRPWFCRSAGGMLGPRRLPQQRPHGQRSSIRVTGQRGRTWHDCKYGEVYDTSGLEENCVWDPKRIKINNTIKPKLNFKICQFKGVE
uniref:Uncharacterized protein n=1 Tax=Seriola dumerili TaxID=41447 RepID=A0A3B4TQV0_SERDU